MVAFAVPSNCGRCGRERKLDAYHLPTLPMKKLKTGFRIQMTPEVWLCKTCGSELLLHIKSFFVEEDPLTLH